jgi:hypothetical protein
VYTGKKAKIAEHGGDNPQDRDVPIVVSGGPIAAGENGQGNDNNQGDDNSQGDGALVNTPVETTQIAPTILRLLGLDPNALRAVQIEHTRPLPLG